MVVVADESPPDVLVCLLNRLLNNPEPNGRLLLLLDEVGAQSIPIDEQYSIATRTTTARAQSLVDGLRGNMFDAFGLMRTCLEIDDLLSNGWSSIGELNSRFSNHLLNVDE